MMARRKVSPDEASDAPTFEDALAELEAVVEAMEEEQLPLEDLVSHYEKGSALLKRCESVLKSARDRLELITLRNQSENALDSRATTLHAAATPPEATELPDDTDDDDDIRLF
jgi:exodeoxyribonuclease VII small subunit